MSDDFDPPEDNPQTALLRVLLDPGAELEGVMQQLLTQCDVNNAVGAQLDVVGKLVGRRRRGLDDDTYRRHIRAQITVNKSSGTINDVLSVARLIIFDSLISLILDNRGQGTYELFVAAAITEELAQTVAAFVQSATSGGVRAIVHFGVSDAAGWFRFDSGPGFDQGHLTDQIG